jgi:hypothetical protein
MNKTTTARPWKISGEQIQSEKINGYGNFILLQMPLRKEPQMQDMTEEDKANQEFIVKAVNNHEALLNACKESLVVLQAYFDAYGTGELLPVIETVKQAINATETR